MSEEIKSQIQEICKSFNNDKMRMMDIVRVVQEKQGFVSGEAMEIIAQETGSNRVEVEGLVSFYAFYSADKKGKMIIRLCNDIVDQMAGLDAIAEAFKSELGIGFGETSQDGKFTLKYTPCIGMCDQAPAAIINDVIVTSLTASKVKDIVSQLKTNDDILALTQELGDGNNADELVKSAVKNNLLKKGEVIFADREADSGLKKAV